MSRGQLSGFEIAALSLFSAALLAATGLALVPYSWAESLGFATGSACVWLAVRQHVLTWPLGLVNNALFFVLFLDARLYADMALQAIYFGLGCYGWWLWITHRNGAPLRVSRITRNEILAVALTIPIGTFLLRELLIRAGGAAPFFDGLTTTISLAAQYLLSRKRIENWILWIVADLLYVPLYMSRDLPLTAALYAVFLAMCGVGLRDWLRAEADVGAPEVAR